MRHARRRNHLDAALVAMALDSLEKRIAAIEEQIAVLMRQASLRNGARLPGKRIPQRQAAQIVPSIRALASLLGVSHTLLNRYYKQGRFAVEPGGGFHPEKVRAALRRWKAKQMRALLKRDPFSPRSRGNW